MIIVKTENTEMFLKKKLLKPTLFFIGVLFIISSTFAQVSSKSDTVLNSKIAKAILSADANSLSDLFHSQIDMVLPNNSGIYSKVQAKFILKEFFRINKPESFFIINENTNKGSNFILGKLHTDNHHYRVCFLTKGNNEINLIYQIRIEK